MEDSGIAQKLRDYVDEGRDRKETGARNTVNAYAKQKGKREVDVITEILKDLEKEKQ